MGHSKGLMRESRSFAPRPKKKKQTKPHKMNWQSAVIEMRQARAN